MSLAHGGHLTHGSPVNFSGKLFNVISHGLTAKRKKSITPKSNVWRRNTSRK